ncbi:hypothetical protein GCM10027565_21920 [Bordetella tumulicola]
METLSNPGCQSYDQLLTGGRHSADKRVSFSAALIRRTGRSMAARPFRFADQLTEQALAKLE